MSSEPMHNALLEPGRSPRSAVELTLTDQTRGPSDMNRIRLPTSSAPDMITIPSNESSSFTVEQPEATRQPTGLLQIPSSASDSRLGSLAGKIRRSISSLVIPEAQPDETASDTSRGFIVSTGEVMSQAKGPEAFMSLLKAPRESHRAISGTRQQAEQTEIPFDECSEARPSCLRRRVVPQSTIGWTKKCVVLDQGRLPDYLFTDLSLVDDHGALVTEFNYNQLECGQQPNIYYGRERWPEGARTGNVQMVTKNSYWNDLLKTLCKCGMLFAMTEYSHLTFITSLPKEIVSNMVGVHAGRKLLLVLIIFYVLRIGAAITSAQMEWHASIESGARDIILDGLGRKTEAEQECQMLPPLRKLRRFDRFRAFLALVIFQLVGVPGLLRDIPIFLHPWKGLQPYAAFKADEARAYLLGFPSAALFRIENRPRGEIRYTLTILETLIMSILKIDVKMSIDKVSSWKTFFECHQFQTFLIVDVLPGAITIIINLIGFTTLYIDKRRCKTWLTDQMHSIDPKQQQVAQRLLKKHFGITFKRTQRPRNSWWQTPEGNAPTLTSQDSSPTMNELPTMKGTASLPTVTSPRSPQATSPRSPRAHGDVESAMVASSSAEMSPAQSDPGAVSTGSSRMKFLSSDPGSDPKRFCAERCAELARELQLWKVGVVFHDEFADRKVDTDSVDKFLWALRDIAQSRISPNERNRGPHKLISVREATEQTRARPKNWPMNDFGGP